jgi:hypothetical protein
MIRLESTGVGPKPVVTQDSTTRQGPLTSAQVLALLDHHGVFDAAYRAASGGVGAHASFDLPVAHRRYDLLTIKFPNANAAQRFGQLLMSLFTTVRHATQVEDHFQPRYLNAIVLVPQSSALGSPLGDTTVADLTYPDGTLLLLKFTTAEHGDAASGLLESLAGRQESEHQLCQRYPKSCGPAPGKG